MAFVWMSSAVLSAFVYSFSSEVICSFMWVFSC